MARISYQLELTVNKADIEDLATDEDLKVINDEITAWEEKK